MADRLDRTDDRTPGDSRVETLYRETRASIPWDGTDDAVLARALEVSLRKPARPATEPGAKVVPFRAPGRSAARRLSRSPAVRFAIAASVLTGLFFGPVLDDTEILTPSATTRGALVEQAQSVDPEVVERIEILPRQFRNILTVLAPALSGPAKDRPFVRPFRHGQTYFEGETLVIEAGIGQKGGYLYASFVQADGLVVHLTPTINAVALAPWTTLRMGENDARYRLTASLGDDLLVVIATETPLFAVARPGAETVQSYRAALDRALRDVRIRESGIDASYTLISVVPRSR